MRQAGTQRGVPLVTTLSAAHATVQAIRALRQGKYEVRALQDIYPESVESSAAAAAFKKRGA